MIDGIGHSGKLVTANDLLALEKLGKSTELVRGKLVVREPPSTYHGRVQASLNVLVGSYVRAHALGAVFGQDTGLRSRPIPIRYARRTSPSSIGHAWRRSRGADTRRWPPISWRRSFHRRTGRAKCSRRRGSGSTPA